MKYFEVTLHENKKCLELDLADETSLSVEDTQETMRIATTWYYNTQVNAHNYFLEKFVSRKNEFSHQDKYINYPLNGKYYTSFSSLHTLMPTLRNTCKRRNWRTLLMENIWRNTMLSPLEMIWMNEAQHPLFPCIVIFIEHQRHDETRTT